MLKIYDIYGNQLGLIVGEFEKELLVLLGKHSVDDFPQESINFDEVELRCAKNIHLLNKDGIFNKNILGEKLRNWWINKYKDLEFSYYLAVIYYNISKGDWTGINFLSYIEKGIFILVSYKHLSPRQSLPFDRGDFPNELEKGRFLACKVVEHPNVVTYDIKKLWDNSKKNSGVYTELSLKSGDKVLWRKLPYFIYAKKGDILLLELVERDQVPSVFVNGMKYSYLQN